MLNWYKNLYIGHSIEKKYRKIRRKIEAGAGITGAYLITLAVNPENQLEIISANFLLQKPVKRNCPMIVGLAGSYEEATEMVCSLAEQVYRETGGLQIRRYITDRT